MSWTDDGSFTGGELPDQRFYRVKVIDRVNLIEEPGKYDMGSAQSILGSWTWWGGDASKIGNTFFNAQDVAHWASAVTGTGLSGKGLHIVTSGDASFYITEAGVDVPSWKVGPFSGDTDTIVDVPDGVESIAIHFGSQGWGVPLNPVGASVTVQVLDVLTPRSEARANQTTDQRPQTIARALGLQSAVKSRSEARGADKEYIFTVTERDVLAVGPIRLTVGHIQTETPEEHASIQLIPDLEVDMHGSAWSDSSHRHSDVGDDWMDVAGSASSLKTWMQHWKTRAAMRFFTGSLNTRPYQNEPGRITYRINEQYVLEVVEIRNDSARVRIIAPQAEEVSLSGKVLMPVVKKEITGLAPEMRSDRFSPEEFFAAVAKGSIAKETPIRINLKGRSWRDGYDLRFHTIEGGRGSEMWVVGVELVESPIYHRDERKAQRISLSEVDSSELIAQGQVSAPDVPIPATKVGALGVSRADDFFMGDSLSGAPGVSPAVAGASPSFFAQLNAEIGQFKYSPVLIREIKNNESVLATLYREILEGIFSGQVEWVKALGSTARLTFVGSEPDFDIVASLSAPRQSIEPQLGLILERIRQRMGPGYRVTPTPPSTGFRTMRHVLNKSGYYFVLSLEIKNLETHKVSHADLCIKFDRETEEREKGISDAYLIHVEDEYARLRQKKGDAALEDLLANIRFARYVLKILGVEIGRKKGGFVSVNTEQLIMQTGSFDRAMSLLYEFAVGEETNPNLSLEQARTKWPLRVITPAVDAAMLGWINEENWKKLVNLARRYHQLKQAGHFELGVLLADNLRSEARASQTTVQRPRTKQSPSPSLSQGERDGVRGVQSSVSSLESEVLPQALAADASSLGAKIGTAIRVAANTVSPLLSSRPAYAGEVAPVIFAGTSHFQAAPQLTESFGKKTPELARLIARTLEVSAGFEVIDQRSSIPDVASVQPLADLARYNPKASVVLALVLGNKTPSPGLSRGERDWVRGYVSVDAFVEALVAAGAGDVLGKNLKIETFANTREFLGRFNKLRDRNASNGVSMAFVTDGNIPALANVGNIRAGQKSRMLRVNVGAVGDKKTLALQQTACVIGSAVKLLDDKFVDANVNRFVSIAELGVTALLAEFTSQIAAAKRTAASA